MKRLAYLLGLAFIGSSCADTECNGNASKKDTAPRIGDFYVVSQLDSDPYQLVVGLDFTDSNGNLGSAGEIDFFLDGVYAEAVSGEAQAFFELNNVATDAESGSLGIPLRFDGIANGTRTRLGVQLVDGAGQRSNCYTLELGFTVTDTASLVVPTSGWRRVACVQAKDDSA